MGAAPGRSPALPGVQAVRWAPWRPVKLLVKLAVGIGTAMAVVWHYTHEPCEP